MLNLTLRPVRCVWILSLGLRKILKKAGCQSQGAVDDIFVECPDHESHITQRHNAQLPLRIPFLKHFQHAHKNIISRARNIGKRRIYKEFRLIMDRTKALNVSFTLSLDDVALMVEE